MFIVDTALKKRAANGTPIRVGMIGVGFIGRGCVNQIINQVPGMDLVAIAMTGSGKTHGFLIPAVIHCKNQPPLQRSDNGPMCSATVCTRRPPRCTCSR